MFCWIPPSHPVLSWPSLFLWFQVRRVLFGKQHPDFTTGYFPNSCCQASEKIVIWSLCPWGLKCHRVCRVSTGSYCPPWECPTPCKCPPSESVFSSAQFWLLSTPAMGHHCLLSGFPLGKYCCNGGDHSYHRYFRIFNLAQNPSNWRGLF